MNNFYLQKLSMSKWIYFQKELIVYLKVYFIDDSQINQHLNIPYKLEKPKFDVLECKQEV